MRRFRATLFGCGLGVALLASGCSVRDKSPTPTATPDDFFVIVTVTPGAPAEEATSASATTTYVVQPGDSLLEIAERFGVTLSDLQEANDIENPDSIFVGQVLEIPEPES